MHTRERIVESARKLFWARGYEATSIAEILKAANVNSGSLYHFFKSKEEVLIAVLERYQELLYPAVIEPGVTATDDPIDQVFAILDGYREGLLKTDFALGCPIGSLALEVAENHPAALPGIRKNFEAWRAAVSDCIGRASDRLPEGASPDRLATLILTVMEGAVMQARVERSIEPFDDCIAELRSYFQRLTASVIES